MSFKIIWILSFLLGYFPFLIQAQLIDWPKTIDRPGSSEMAIEYRSHQFNTESAYIKAIEKRINGLNALMQTYDASMFRKQIKFSGNIKLKGDANSTSYEIVFDIPKNDSILNYSILFSRTGEVWMDDLIIVITSIQINNSGKKRLCKTPDLNYEN